MHFTVCSSLGSKGHVPAEPDAAVPEASDISADVYGHFGRNQSRSNTLHHQFNDGGHVSTQLHHNASISIQAEPNAAEPEAFASLADHHGNSVRTQNRSDTMPYHFIDWSHATQHQQVEPSRMHHDPNQTDCSSCSDDDVEW